MSELLEAPQAVTGDLDWDEAKLRISDVGFQKFWKTVGHLPTAIGLLTIARGRDAWIVGTMRPRDNEPGRQDFRALIRVDGEKLQKALPYTNPMIVRFVYVAEDDRTTGLASAFYQYLVNTGLTLIGDAEQYVGARRLWARLSVTPGYVVDLLNITSGEVIEATVTISHDREDAAFDQKVWSADESLIHIRPVLRRA